MGKRFFLYSCITFLVVLLAVEVGLHVIDFAARRLQPSPAALPFRGLYQDQEWAPALARESDKPHRDQTYHQYLTWISKPVRGQFVNIDPDTGRRAWNPPDLLPDAATVYLFGGSAAWGWGARDDGTIASQLSRLLNARAPRVRVYNFAEPAYTFTQGVLYLILKLREGARPDFVIFYDGFNDVYGAYQSGQAGALQNLATMREKLEAKPRKLLRLAVKDWLQGNLYLYSKVYLGLYFAFHPEARFQEVGAGLSEPELDKLAEGLVHYYARSLLLVDKLSRAYGFRYACFWQPSLLTEAQVLPGEGQAEARLQDQNFARLYRITNQYLAEQKLPHFYNLADAVSKRTRPCYLDLAHLTEAGYGLVADRMDQVLQKEFPANPEN
ncbi:MAG: SGNH/GDSL hydrolase family protein [Desulfobaccales bacterium]